MKLKRRRPSPAMVVACIALSVALSGAGYAAVKLPRGSVGTVQLKNNAVVSAKVKNGSLKTADIAPGVLPPNFNGAAAGGSLAGSYPNPTLAPGAVTPDAVGAVPAVRAQSPSESFNNDQILNNGDVPEPIVFDEEAYDNANFHQPGNYDVTGSYFTVPRTGVYALSGGLIFGAPSAGSYGSKRQLFITRDADTTVGGDETYVAGNNVPPMNPGATVMEVSGIALLNAGDVVQLWMSHDAATDLVTPLSQFGLVGDGRHFFAMTWLGPAS